MLKSHQILTKFPTNSIKSLFEVKKQYIYKTVVNKNIQLLKRYIGRYPNIKTILQKYNLMDLSSNNTNSNLLLEFYKYIYKSNKYIVDNGDILLTISINQHFNLRGKYKSFIILYFLGILQRKTINSMWKGVPNTYYDIKQKHIPSCIKIIQLTDEIFKNINIKCNQLINLNWNSIRYFNVVETFGEEVADELYNNKICKIRYNNYSLKAKEDIINMLKNDQIVFLEGFITKHKIFDYVKQLNTNREQNSKKYNKVYKGFYKFISSLLLYNEEVKSTLDKLGLMYTTLNKEIIQHIEEYQKIHNFPNSTKDLKSNMKVIVLKILL